MANSRIGQFQLEFQLDGYTSPTRSHVVRINCQAVGSPLAGTPAASITMQQRSGATIALDAAANQAWSFLRLNYAIAITASSYTLWRWATENARDFISTGTLSNPLGAAGSTVQAGQTTLTFRAAAGGIAKLVLIESNNAGDARAALVANGAGTSVQRLAAYAISGDSIMTALDNSFLVSPLRDARGQNEAIWRKINRA